MKGILFLKSLPEGFNYATELLNMLPVKIIVDMSEKIMKYILQVGYGLEVDNVKKTFDNFKIDMEKKEIQSVINLLMHIFKGGYNEKLDTKIFAKLLVSNTQINTKLKKIIILEYEKFQGKMAEQRSKPLQLMRLREMDWKLGVSLASNHCKKLDSGKIVLSFVTDSEEDSHRERHTVELTISQFKEMYTHFKKMKETLDSTM